MQNWPFFHFFLLGMIGQENVFYDILERRNGFLGYKNSKLKSGKFAISGKGLTHGFGRKLAIFLFVFFCHYRPGRCVLR